MRLMGTSPGSPREMRYAHDSESPKLARVARTTTKFHLAGREGQKLGRQREYLDVGAKLRPIFGPSPVWGAVSGS